MKKHLLTKPCSYLHVVEGSPLELVELLLLESSLSGGCSEHIGVGQAAKAPDIKSIFQRQLNIPDLCDGRLSCTWPQSKIYKT